MEDENKIISDIVICDLAFESLLKLYPGIIRLIKKCCKKGPS